MNKQKIEEGRRMAHYILTSGTKEAQELWRLLNFYHDSLDKAPPLPEEKPPCGGLIAMAQEVLAQQAQLKAKIRETERLARKVYEERTGKKWRPSLKMCEGGNKPLRRKAKRPALLVLSGGNRREQY